MDDFASLLHGDWLPATSDLRHHELELTWGEKRIFLTVLDYPGELYRQLFFENRVDTDALNILYEHASRALGVILLIDPTDATSSEQCVETECSALQVVEHFRSGSDGRAPPVVLVYTKRDQTARLIENGGGLARFTRANFPRLSRALPGVPLVHLASVSTHVTKDGKRIPTTPSRAQQVLMPLELIFRELTDREQHGKDRVRRCGKGVAITFASVLVFMAFFLVGMWVGAR